VVPPGNGIVHQVNLESLAQLVLDRDGWMFPDTLIGTGGRPYPGQNCPITNTANPAAMVAAGPRARNALAHGLRGGPRIKASLSPGSLAVNGYSDALGLLTSLQEVGFWLAGGMLPSAAAAGVREAKIKGEPLSC
jgi:aconitase A